MSLTSSDNPSTGPLTGLTVIDLTRALAGPHAAMMLGDLGAEVIKVESPTGDDTRGWGPPFAHPDGADRESTYFLCANRNKKSITLDLKTDAGRTALEALLQRADVLMENFRPGVLDRLGFAEQRLLALNPQLIMLSISGFGHDGPEAGRAGYDQIAQGEAGLMAVTGSGPHDPQRVGVPIADLLAGMYGAFGVLAALQERERTGRGQVVRSSLLAAVVGVHAFQGTKWTVAGKVGEATGNHHPSICPYGLFDTADGAVQIAVGSEGLWQRFCAGFNLDPATPGMESNPQRVANQKRVNELVQSVFALHPTDELLATLDRIGVPAGRIRTIREVYEWDQTRSQGLLVDVDHATLGTITLPGPPLRFFDIDGAERTRRRHTAPPVLGADNNLVEQLLGGGR
ncbi:CaiB/BaiF CoA transferase family protein [Mycolicibacterium mageritense]|uniref:Acetyl-CoA:oxalate CoA-transferase n=1 Tax=Mycolicibacterium mageritense TaxID=53462 RepID=A0AAI8TV94_MYCME|nr:CoA transferase [Mycolicibacterium mageritense]TXI66101.1 MAG: CoA transferase [Mycolicibacterium mageritense]BDY29031.1 Acetyl-CoA:oxalate CoA-transferase [Mycolicibacterium mageritense]